MPTDVGTIVLAIIVQTVVIGYWAGQVRQMLKDHERRIGDVERSMNHHLMPDGG